MNIFIVIIFTHFSKTDELLIFAENLENVRILRVCLQCNRRGTAISVDIHKLALIHPQ